MGEVYPPKATRGWVRVIQKSLNHFDPPPLDLLPPGEEKLYFDSPPSFKNASGLFNLVEQNFHKEP